MLKRMIAALAALAACLTGSSVQKVLSVPPGDYPELCTSACVTVTLDLDANITTGYKWSAEILQGDSVVVDESASGYVSDPNPDMMDGVGGTTYYKLDAVCAGDTLIRFVYMRGYDDIAQSFTALACVDEDLMIHVYDVTEGILEE